MRLNQKVKVIDTDGGSKQEKYLGKIGIIYDLHQSFPDVKFDDGNIVAFAKSRLQEVEEIEFMTLKEAQKATIDGQKVTTATIDNPGWYMYFNGEEFRYVCGAINEKAIGIFDYTKWKIYEEPKREPKFSKGQFIVAKRGNGYFRIADVEYIDNKGYKYYLTAYDDEQEKDQCITSMESNLKEVE